MRMTKTKFHAPVALIDDFSGFLLETIHLDLKE